MNTTADIHVGSLLRRNDVPSEANADLIQATRRLIAMPYQFLRTARQRRASIRALEALSDRLLRDIGLARQDIPDHVARFVAVVAMPSDRPSPVRRAGQTLRAAWQRLRIRRRARITARQLSDLDCGLQMDIGLAPGDIDRLAREMAERSLATPKPAKRQAPPRRRPAEVSLELPAGWATRALGMGRPRLAPFAPGG